MSNLKIIALLAIMLAIACTIAIAFEPIVYTIAPDSRLLVNYTETAYVQDGSNPLIGGSPVINITPSEEFCPVAGWSVLQWQQQAKVDNWTVVLEDIGVASSACQNGHPAILSVFDENNNSIGARGSYSVCPEQNLTIMRDSDNRSIVLNMGKTAIGISPSAGWLELWGQSPNCSNEYLDENFSIPVENTIPPAPLIAMVNLPPNETSAGAPPSPSPAPLPAPPAPLPAPTSTPPYNPTSPSPKSLPSSAPNAVPTSAPSTPPVPPQAPSSQPPSGGSDAVGAGDTSSQSGNSKINPYAQTSSEKSALPSVPKAPASALRTELSQSAPSAPADISSTLPWWLAPAIVASLGAFFMAVMVFYYRTPSVFAPAPSVPATPIYLSDSRLALMGELSQTERIPTDIAIRLNKSKSTISEQLDELCALGLVERIAQPGKKFVFYRLSRSGRNALLQRADEQKKPAPLLPF